MIKKRGFVWEVERLSVKYAGKLKEYQAIGIGFVDGDLHILYAR